MAERAASYGRAGFALQFMLDTSLSDGDRFPLKIQDLIVMSLNPMMGHVKLAWAADPALVHNDLPAVALVGDRYYRPMWHSPEMADYTGCVMAIDPSGRGSDETGYAIVKILNAQLYLVAAGGLKGGYEDDTLKALANLAKTHQVNHVIIEANFGDGMYTKLITPFFSQVGHKVLVEEVKHSTQKEQRIIDTLEPILSTHKLVVDQRVIEQDFRTAEADIKYSLFYQLTRITRDRGALTHDDRLDALAMAVAYWVEHMSKDVSKAHEVHREKALQEELKRWRQGITGKKDRSRNWMGTNKARRA
nr:phage terminase large subunit [Pseudoduganella lutea]